MRHRLPDPAVRSMVDLAFDHTRDENRATEELAAMALDRKALEAAHLELVQRMHTGPSDDFEATAALRRILSALASMPRDYGHPPVWSDKS